MKTSFKALAILALTSVAAQAITFTDVNPEDVRFHPTLGVGTINSYSGNYEYLATSTYTGTFDITPAFIPGYAPHTIVTATAYFDLFDYNAGNERVKVTLTSGGSVYNASNFSGTLTVGGSLLSIDINDLNADGKLDYTITRISGGFDLKNAELTASSLPDGGTTVLSLGLGLFGLEIMRRRFARA